jgi:hypothetical protein
MRDLRKKGLAVIAICLAACISLGCLFGCGGANNSTGGSDSNNNGSITDGTDNNSTGNGHTAFH